MDQSALELELARIVMASVVAELQERHGLCDAVQPFRLRGERPG